MIFLEIRVATLCFRFRATPPRESNVRVRVVWRESSCTTLWSVGHSIHIWWKFMTKRFLIGLSHCISPQLHYYRVDSNVKCRLWWYMMGKGNFFFSLSIVSRLLSHSCLVWKLIRIKDANGFKTTPTLISDIKGLKIIRHEI